VLAALIIVPLGLLALLAFAIYLAVAHPGDAWPVTIALQGALWIFISGHLAWKVIRGRAGSPENLPGVLSEVCALLCITVGLAGAISQSLGWWTHGIDRDLVTSVSGVILLGVAVYWAVGERRLRAALQARAAPAETAS
jgi:hypothetical protein